MAGKSIEEIAIGEKASFSKTITEGDVYLYAGIIGDLNPAHIDEEAAKKGIFGKRIAHGMLTAGLVSTVLYIWDRNLSLQNLSISEIQLQQLWKHARR